MARNDELLNRLALRLIDRGMKFGSFQCSKELDWFLNNKACSHHEERISTVTCWLDGDEIAGYMSTSMTNVELIDPTQRRDIGVDGVIHREGGGFEKRFPALLIGMLGVCARYERNGLGPHMVQHAVGQAREATAGCRFVTVDSMPTERALGMYGKLGFKQVKTKKAEERKTVWMYFDLGPRPR